MTVEFHPAESSEWETHAFSSLQNRVLYAYIAVTKALAPHGANHAEQAAPGVMYVERICASPADYGAGSGGAAGTEAEKKRFQALGVLPAARRENCLAVHLR